MPVSWSIDGTKDHRLVPLPSECAPSIDVSDLYFEVVYGPLIGPTSVALARNLARKATTALEATYVDLVEVAFEIGVRASRLEPLGRTSPIVRAFDRLHHHQLLTVLADGVLGTYVSVPSLADKFIRRLPPAANEFHQRFLISSGNRSKAVQDVAELGTERESSAPSAPVHDADQLQRRSPNESKVSTGKVQRNDGMK